MFLVSAGVEAELVQSSAMMGALIRRVRYIVAFTLLLLLIADSGWCEEFRKIEVDTLDLTTAFQMALDHNPTLQQSLANLNLTELQIQEAYNALNPTLYATLSELYVKQKIRSFRERDGELTLNIPIYNFGQVYWNARAAKLTRNKAGQDLRAQVQTMIQQVAVNFVEARLNDQLADISKLRVDDRKAYLKQASDLLDAGEIAEFEKIQAESNVLAAQESLSSAQQEASTSLATLLVDLGVRPDMSIELAQLPELQPPPEVIDQGLAQALRNRPEIESLRWQVMAYEATAKASGRRNAPQLAFYSDYDSLDEGSAYEPTWETGLQLTWQLFDGGAAKNAARQARAQADIIRGQLGAQERQVALDVTTAFVQMKQLWPQITLAEKSLKKAEETLTIAQYRFKAGLSSGIELLNAQDGLSSARIALAQAEANYRLATINWRRATSADYPVEVPASWQEAWTKLEPGTEPEPEREPEMEKDEP